MTTNGLSSIQPLPGETTAAFVDRATRAVHQEVDRRLGNLSGEALRLEAHRMHEEVLAQNPDRKIRADLVRQAHAQPDRIPALIQQLRDAPETLLPDSEIGHGIVVGTMIEDLETLRAYYAGDLGATNNLHG